MSQITVSQNPGILDPELLALGRHIASEMILSAEKAAAHTADPGAFPVPEDAALEKLFLERFRAMPAERQKRAGAKAVELFRGPEGVRTALVGSLADLDVSKAAPVSELVRARPVPSVRLTAEKLEQAFTRGAPPAKIKLKPIRPKDATEWLELRLHHIKCVDETDGLFGSEAGSDEIHVGALLVDPIQRTTKPPIQDLGEFGSDGAERGFSPPLVLGGWDLRVGFYWPRTCTAMVYLSEVDEGGFPEWLQKVFEFAKSKVVSAVTTAIGAAIGGLLGAGIGALVGALVGWVIGELIGAIKTWWEDDVFAPGTLTVNLAAADATFGGQTTSPQFQFRYAGHGGEYVLSADVRLTTRPGEQTSPLNTTGPLDDLVTDLGGVACGLTVEPASPTKIRDPLTGTVTTIPAPAISIERPLVFAIGRKDDSMMFRDLSRPDSPWTSIGGGFRSGPAVALTSPTRPVVFGRGTDDALWHAWRDNAGAPWSAWHSLGGGLTSAPAATMSGSRLVVAVRGTDMAIHHKWHENGWSDWQSLGGIATSAPAIVQSGKRLIVFCRGTDGAIHHKWYEGGWSDWHSLGGVSHSAPAAMVGAKKQGIVFCRGTDSAIYERHYAGSWTPWASLGIP